MVELIYPGASSHGRALAAAMAKPRIKRGADGAHARELDRHVGARMRARRIMLGLTQQQLAERIGIAYQQAHKYEKGINRMAVSRLYKVAQALGVDVGYFFEGLHRAEESPSGVTPQQRLVLELAKNFMTLSPEHQQAICTIVRMLSEPAAIRRLGPLSLDVQSPGRPNTAEPAATTASPAAEASPEPIGGSAHTASMP